MWCNLEWGSHVSIHIIHKHTHTHTHKHTHTHTEWGHISLSICKCMSLYPCVLPCHVSVSIIYACVDMIKRHVSLLPHVPCDVSLCMYPCMHGHDAKGSLIITTPRILVIPHYNVPKGPINPSLRGPLQHQRPYFRDDDEPTSLGRDQGGSSHELEATML